MWLHQLARPLKPRGGAIKESLAHSQHFFPSSPISSSLPFSYEVWSLSHSFDIPTNKAGRFSQGQSKKSGNITCLYVEVAGVKVGGGWAAVNSYFPSTGPDERCVAAKKYSWYIAAAASMEKTAQIHINGFD